MMNWRWLVLACTLPLTLLMLLADGAYQPQKLNPKPPSEAQQREILTKAKKLDNAIASLKRQGVHAPALTDIEVYYKAAEWVVRFGEVPDGPSAKRTIDVLNRGLLRASQQAAGEAPWLAQTGRAVVRAYRSRIDNSIQPYAVTFPKNYGKERGKQWRIDVVLHGRNGRLTEVLFLNQHNGDAEAPEQDFVKLEVYGRGNNAYRWSGEMDVYEALDNFIAVESLLKRSHLLDPDRIVLRGFSMGGAGTWHLGLHAPSRWTVIGPGAGFTRTHGYVKNLPEKLPEHQEACLHIYDAVDYAENARHIPVVAYGGSKDKQLQASLNIQERLKPLNIPMTLLIGEGLAHKFPPEWQKKAEAEYRKHLTEEPEPYPERVQFVTYTMKYAQCEWVEILGLDEHYRKANVDAQKTASGFTVKCENVRALHLGVEPGLVLPKAKIDINGQTVETRPYLDSQGEYHVYLQRRGKDWHAVLPQRLVTESQRVLQKRTNLQGPIDDAFMGSFLCVIGTGTPWHHKTAKYAELNLRRFRMEWGKYLRGNIEIKRDDEVTPQDLATKHLILFGDPGSNSLIKEVLDQLPLTWTKKEITIGKTTVDAGEHVPAMIYPSPLHANLYVVLNSGHTFHAKDFQGTNALLYPRLGDYALLKLTPTESDPLEVEVVTAGLFDDFWRLKGK